MTTTPGDAVIANDQWEGGNASPGAIRVGQAARAALIRSRRPGAAWAREARGTGGGVYAALACSSMRRPTVGAAWSAKPAWPAITASSVRSLAVAVATACRICGEVGAER